MTEEEKIQAIPEKDLKGLRKVLDELIEDGIIQVVGMREGHKVYGLTEVGRSPHLIMDPPKKMQ
jgi:DNA-binding HxlR family transcriptional regulator